MLELTLLLLLESEEPYSELTELPNEPLIDELDREPGQHGHPGMCFIVMALLRWAVFHVDDWEAVDPLALDDLR